MKDRQSGFCLWTLGGPLNMAQQPTNQMLLLLNVQRLWYLLDVSEKKPWGGLCNLTCGGFNGSGMKFLGFGGWPPRITLQVLMRHSCASQVCELDLIFNFHKVVPASMSCGPADHHIVCCSSLSLLVLFSHAGHHSGPHMSLF